MQGPEELLRKLEAEGELPIRLYVMVRGETNEAMNELLPHYRYVRRLPSPDGERRFAMGARRGRIIRQLLLEISKTRVFAHLLSGSQLRTQRRSALHRATTFAAHAALVRYTPPGTVILSGGGFSFNAVKLYDVVLPDPIPGKGEMLCQYASRHGITGVGIDLFAPYATVAKERATELGIELVGLEVGDDRRAQVARHLAAEDRCERGGRRRIQVRVRVDVRLEIRVDAVDAVAVFVEPVVA